MKSYIRKRERPVREKLVLKVFGKGFGGEPFLRKVSPDKSTDIFISISQGQQALLIERRKKWRYFLLY